MTTTPPPDPTPDHANLRRLAEAATPGPWYIERASTPAGEEPWGKVIIRSHPAGGAGTPLPGLSVCWRGRVGHPNAAYIAAANPQAVLGLLEEIDRLRNGGCARDQRTTQFCAEVVERDKTIGELRARIAHLEAGLDAIARINDGRGHCLSTCASNANPDADCDCGYVAAEEPGSFAADVVAGEACLDGALKLDTTDRSES